MKNRRNFWDRTAIIYDRFMRRDAAAYDRMYALLRPVVRDKTVLELAAGTGLIAKHIANAAEYIEVTDASEQMIRQAERENHAENLRFSVQDMFSLPYAEQIIRCGNRIKRTAHCASARKITARNQTGAEG